MPGRRWKGDKWTKEEDAKLAELYPTCPMYVMLEQFKDRTARGLYERARLLGLRKYKRVPPARVKP